MRRRWALILGMAGILIATTVGAGLFTLPWVFHSAGWVLTSIWVLALSILIIFAQYSYWRILESVDEKERLVALARRHLGAAWGVLALTSIIGGMLFVLIIYLSLAERFLSIVLPVRPLAATLIFWVLAVLPATFSIKRFALAESLGSFFKAALIFFVLFSASRPAAVFEGVAFQSSALLLPFGIVLFSLSGWTAIEPMYEFWKESKDKHPRGRTINPLLIISAGVGFIAILYFVFSAGIIGSLEGASFLTADSLSGLIAWPFWKLAALAVLGLSALWTAYAPTAKELESALREDLRWNSTLAFLVVAIVPLIMVLGGFINIIQAVTFAGGVFFALQYITIFALAEKVLRHSGKTIWCLRASAMVFAVAALYEIYIFII